MLFYLILKYEMSVIFDFSGFQETLFKLARANFSAKFMVYRNMSI